MSGWMKAATRTFSAAGLAVILVTIVATAQAAPSTKLYSVALAPTQAVAGSTATYALTLSNAGASTQTLGSANVTVPAGFTVRAVGTPAAADGKTWTATPAANVIELRALDVKQALAPGQSVSVDLSVETACPATEQAWKSQAKQSNSFSGPPGNDFTNSGADPALSIAPGAAVTLAFVAQPGRTGAGTPISPAVKIAGRDACGSPAEGNVAIALGSNPSGATLGGTLTQALSSGTATFADLTVDASGIGYTLIASAPGASSATSDAFNVVDHLCTTPADCVASDKDETTTVTTQGPPSGGSMALSFTKRETFTCGTSSLTTRGALAVIDPVGYTTAIRASTRWSKSVAPGTGVANFTFCWSKDGVQFEQAAPCTKSGKLPDGVGLCELKRNRNGVGELVIEFLIDPVDPWGGLG